MVVATYDVSDDRRRARLAALLQSWGDRVQRSVFILTLDDATLAEVSALGRSIINPDQDSFYLFRQCASCWEVLDCIGQAQPPQPTLYWSVW